MNAICFPYQGKSIERVRDRMKLHFCRTYWQFNRLQNMSGYRGCKIISPDLVLVFTTPKQAHMNKPLQIGATILEHSKVSLKSFSSKKTCESFYFPPFLLQRVMYDKFYNFIIPTFQDVQLSTTDTGNSGFSELLSDFYFNFRKFLIPIN